MQLLKTYSYDDPKGIRWLAPEGSIIDGASIPQALWSISGSPFSGLYRDASVMHDVYCASKSRDHDLTHNMFWDLMIASGVDEDKADRMWWAVAHFGPQWDTIGKALAETKEKKAFMAGVMNEG